MEARWAELGEFGWPAPDAVVLLWSVRLVMAAVIAAGVVWLVRSMRRARVTAAREPMRDAGGP